MTTSQAGFGPALTQARRAIHDDDVERLARIVADFPELLSHRSGRDDGGVLEIATRAFRDSFDADSEARHTRPACAEYLLDAGAVVAPGVLDGLVESRARGLLGLFERKGLLPRTLKFRTALGDAAGVRDRLADEGTDINAVGDAFICACRFERADLASLLLDRAMALDAELARHVDGGPGPAAFIEYITATHGVLAFIDAAPAGPWQAYRMQHVVKAVEDDDLDAFLSELRREPWLLGGASVGFQVGLVERATLHGRGAFIDALLELEPALLRRRPPPPTQAFELAFTYAKSEVVPLLTRVWPLPDDLPHAAASGDLDRVRGWFDDAGEPALGNLLDHFPADSDYTRGNLQWGAPAEQQVLDTALAWAVVNDRFDVADFLLAHGADIDTRWGSHEPASILHELVFHGNYAAMQFLIDRGIDMTITDHRWNATARGWALHAAGDERMAEWLGAAERDRGRDST